MFFLVVALYFLLACFATWMVFFPANRDVVTQTASGAVTRLEARFKRWIVARTRRIAEARSSSRIGLADAARFMKRHSLIFAIAAMVVCLPPTAAWLLSDRSMLDGFDVSTRDVNVQIAELLKGEQLVPPAALPPDVFATTEVMQIRPMLSDASRNWQLLSPDFTQRLLMVFRIMKEKHGYEMAILEGYRSPARQTLLASQGASVTNAAAFQSYHQYGLAADCAFLRNGRLVISEKDPWAMKGYELYGQVAESVGLHWGGHWQMRDFGHTELRLPGVMKH